MNAWTVKLSRYPLMSYKLEFETRALKEWHKLDSHVQEQFKKKLAEHLIKPIVQSSRISGARNCYKIKLRSSGYRLIYQVQDEQITIFVVAIGKREAEAAYTSAKSRL